MNFEDKDTLAVLIKGCCSNDRKAQRSLYKLAFPYGMGICLRYANDRMEAEDILNEAFLKIFAKIGSYHPDKSFKAWIRRVFVNTAIDHFRKNAKHALASEELHENHSSYHPDAMEERSAEDILLLISQLPPAYRMVMNLYAIEGYNHKEIGEMLKISEGTSKSNLARARVKLKKMIMDAYQDDRTIWMTKNLMKD